METHKPKANSFIASVLVDMIDDVWGAQERYNRPETTFQRFDIADCLVLYYYYESGLVGFRVMNHARIWDVSVYSAFLIQFKQIHNIYSFLILILFQVLWLFIALDRLIFIKNIFQQYL